jgi:hypothetical protein
MAAIKIKQVHPLADLFPMLSKPELEALASDIKANGLRDPIKVTADGTLVEGRNRLAACKLVGVEPRFETVNGDAGDLIISANIFRRNMTKGQIAVLAVVAEQGIDLPGKASALSAKHPSRSARRNYDYVAQTHKRVANLVSNRVIGEAVDIVEWAPELAEGILESGSGWVEARETAAERKRAARSEESRRKILAEDSPDLLAQVDDEGGITFAEAWKIRDQRIADERATVTRLNNYLVMALRPLLDKTDAGIVETVDYYDPEVANEFGVAEIDEAIEYLRALRAEFKRQKKG